MSMKTITVEVTQADIDEGERGHCAQCPIAKAMERTTGEVWHVTLFGAFPRDRYVPTAQIPSKVQEFILAFDRGEPVTPFTFTLEVPG